MAGRKLNHVQLAKALAGMTDLSHRAAADRLGVSSETVAELRRDYGLLSPAPVGLTEAQHKRRQALAKALEQLPAISHREAGRRLGCHWLLVRQVREAYGLPAPGARGQVGPRRDGAEQRRELAGQLARLGGDVSHAAAARLLGSTWRLVRDVREEHGLPVAEPRLPDRDQLGRWTAREDA